MRKFIALCMLAACAVGLQHSPAAAAPEDFDCRGSALRIDSQFLDTEPVVSNIPQDPCVDDADTLATLKVGEVKIGPIVVVPALVRANTLNTSTTSEDNSGAATSSVQTVNTVGSLAGIAATAVSSEARAECSATGTTFTGSSSIANLKIGGQVINVAVPPNTLVPIPANPLLNVRINEQTISPDGTTFTVRAVHIFSPALFIDIVIAESIASSHDCDVAPPVGECNDGVDNGDPDSLPDAQDPGCHTDGDPNDGDDTYVPTDPSESDPECSDSIDNGDDDTVADINDPGCHTDGNPNNPGSYDPLDPSEDDPECSDGVDNGDIDTVADIDDPNCHSDGDPTNPGSYDPLDPSEDDPECSDTIDNGDDDTVADRDDPGCHIDGDPNDGDNTYNPLDPSETDECPTTTGARNARSASNVPEPCCPTDGDGQDGFSAKAAKSAKGGMSIRNVPSC